MAGLAKKVRARPAAARRACAGAQKLRVCRVVPGLQFGACAKAGRAVGLCLKLHVIFYYYYYH